MNETSLFTLDEIDASTWHHVLTLRSQVFVEEQQCIYLDPDSQDHSALHMIMRQDGDVVAYARLYEATHWHIGRIIVAKSHRGKALGKKLVTEAVAVCKDRGAEEIEMSAQVYLSDFYRSLGFEVTGSMYLEDGIPHVRMCYHHSLK